jgi:hypothetical protein
MANCVGWDEPDFDWTFLIRDLLPIETECTSKTLAPLNRDERRLLYDLLRRLVEG